MQSFQQSVRYYHFLNCKTDLNIYFYLTLEPCEDTSTKCAKFVPKFCTKNKFVMEKCKASCGICGKFH